MRLVTYRSERGDRAGVLTDAGVVDAWDTLGEEGASLRALLAGGRLSELEEGVTRASRTIADPALSPPIPDPEKIVCMGLNYRSHAEEAGVDPPESPTFFAKFRNALAAPAATVTLPAGKREGGLRGGGRIRRRQAGRRGG
jgi:2-keto-4-pentenoate hydratase/2-oxohepta-3-ene-1,7-dioic acid hydratase in catechol pathway